MPLIVKDAMVLFTDGSVNCNGLVFAPDCIIEPAEYLEVRCSVTNLPDSRVGLGIIKNTGFSIQADLVIIESWFGSQLFGLHPFLQGDVLSAKLIEGTRYQEVYHFLPKHIDLHSYYFGSSDGYKYTQRIDKCEIYRPESLKNIKKGIAG
jgi:hypothetical protein